jgi:hypothetical protein
MKVKFANDKVYEGQSIDEAIAKCLSDGNDPFNPVVLQEEIQKKTTKNADTVE